MESDLRETVHAAQRGDEAAFDTLFARNLSPLVAFIRMKAGGVVLSRESASDLAQSVCREVLVDMDDFDYRGENEFRNWLFIHATRKILDRARFHKAAKRDVDHEVAPTDADEMLDCYATFCTPSREAGAREELSRLEDAIAALPENQRDAIALSRVLGLPYPDVAERMVCTEAAVRGLVARGLATLSTSLGGRESST